MKNEYDVKVKVLSPVKALGFLVTLYVIGHTFTNFIVNKTNLLCSKEQ